jgi:hypothetical protein
MVMSTNYNIDQLRDYSSLFLRNEVQRWYKNDLSSLRMKVDRYDRPLLKKKISYLTYLRKVYRVLESFYPNAYIYKNEFITQWLLQEIGFTNSVVYSELRLGKAVADLAMFNGVSKAFEIKTLLDKEARLSNQLEQYRQLFNEVYLIVPATKASQYIKHDLSIGVIGYDENQRSFSLIKQAAHREDINTDVLMQVLHTHEYVSLVERQLGERPRLHDFNKFRICKELIAQMPKDAVSKHFVTLMKERKNQNAFSKKDSQLNQVSLSMNYTPEQKRRLISNLSTIIC